MEWLILFGFVWMVLSLGLYISRSRPRNTSSHNIHQIIQKHEIEESKTSIPTSRFLQRLFIGSLLIRLGLIALFVVTDAIRILRLSPDSERYHRVGVNVALEMQQGFFNWPNWIDNGWFQFAGFVYYLFGPYPILIQILNAILGALTPVVVYFLVKRAFGIEKTARWTAILTAFFPSFIYWSCLMLKDPLSIFAMALLGLSVVSIRERFSVRWLIVMSFSLTIFLGVREYMFFVALFFVALSYLPVEGRRTGPLLVKMLLMVVLIGCATWAMGFGFLGADYIAKSHYFDLDYINSTRVAIGDHGSGAFFSDPSSALWGKDLVSTLKALLAAIYFSFISLDLTSLGSVRQLMALPEVLVTVMLLPHLFRGLAQSWRYLRQETLPLMVFAFGILAVYGSATTNMGAMFRWRMQALPFLLAFLLYGLTLHGRGWLYRMLSRLRI